MFALLTLPRGVPIDPELPALAALAEDEDGEPAGIIIRPGPAPERVPLRDALAGTRALALA
ncbi:hypothetical protein [Longimicrobium sp.]|uniref:hypothetical protein n=1 Tax=Longimicrobium sp. TaxID=2029185 RepID=UPI002B9D8049|nr:hypothetical protein [Longimicrobium sp.]HSU15986.1 hypothetical protein [Longimicrobium sp.]